jgi:hypothetical protein
MDGLPQGAGSHEIHLLEVRLARQLPPAAGFRLAFPSNRRQDGGATK